MNSIMMAAEAPDQELPPQEEDDEAILGQISDHNLLEFMKLLRAECAGDEDSRSRQDARSPPQQHSDQGKPKKTTDKEATPQVNTMYKTVAQKVQPVDDYPSDGSVPAGSTNWKEKALEEIQDRLPLKLKDGLFRNIQPRFTTMPP
jgi:hypothetical protein